jgi:hypothetical protein
MVGVNIHAADMEIMGPGVVIAASAENARTVAVNGAKPVSVAKAVITGIAPKHGADGTGVVIDTAVVNEVATKTAASAPPSAAPSKMRKAIAARDVGEIGATVVAAMRRAPTRTVQSPTARM